MDARQLAAFQEALADLSGAADYEVRQLLRLLSFEAADPVFVREALEDALPVLVDKYGQVANEISAEWFIDLDPTDGYRPIVAPPKPDEQVVSSAKWAAQPAFAGDPAKVLGRVTGSVQRFVYGQARDTIVLNSNRLGVPFARVARADGCAFCRMLASRGFVYEDEKAAGGVTPDHYHDSCRCIVLPKRRGVRSLDVPNLSKFRAQYYNARSDIDNTMSKDALRTILSRMSAA